MPTVSTTSELVSAIKSASSYYLSNGSEDIYFHIWTFNNCEATILNSDFWNYFKNNKGLTSSTPWLHFTSCYFYNSTNNAYFKLFSNSSTNVYRYYFDSCYFSGSMYDMFSNRNTITTIEFTNGQGGPMKMMRGMFNNCSNLETLTVANWDIGSCTDISYWLHGCSKLSALNKMETWTGNSSSLKYMRAFACGLTSLKSIDASAINTYYVTEFRDVFYKSSGLKFIDISTWRFDSCGDSCWGMLSSTDPATIIFRSGQVNTSQNKYGKNGLSAPFPKTVMCYDYGSYECIVNFEDTYRLPYIVNSSYISTSGRNITIHGATFVLSGTSGTDRGAFNNSTVKASLQNKVSPEYKNNISLTITNCDIYCYSSYVFDDNSYITDIILNNSCLIHGRTPYYFRSNILQNAQLWFEYIKTGGINIYSFSFQNCPNLKTVDMKYLKKKY